MDTFDINKIQLKIQSPGVVVNEELNTYIHGQIEKLGKVYNRLEGCELMLREEKSSTKQNSTVGAKLFIPGEVIFASGKSENFKLAVKIVFDDLHEQLYKFKEKIMDKTNPKYPDSTNAHKE